MIARTASFNVASAACAALGGVIVARVVGPTVRGEYAAVTSWLGVLLMVGEVGQTAAVCFFVARDPHHARGYVATSRTMMLVTGAAALAAASWWRLPSHMGTPGCQRLPAHVRWLGHRLRRCQLYLLAPGRSSSRWNLVRLSQPALGLGGDRRAVAAPAADPADRHRDGDRDNGDSARLRLVLVPADRACPGALRPRTGPPPHQVRSDAAHRGHACGGQHVPGSACRSPKLVPPADLGRYAIAVSVAWSRAARVRHRQRGLPPLAPARAVGAQPPTATGAVLASAGLVERNPAPRRRDRPLADPAVFGPALQRSGAAALAAHPGGVFLACGQVAGDLLRGLGRPGLVAAAQGLAVVFTVILLITLLPSCGSGRGCRSPRPWPTGSRWPRWSGSCGRRSNGRHREEKSCE